MDFVTAVKTALGKYATFSGRASRPEYWWFIAFYIICSLVAAVIDGAILHSDASPVSSIISIVLLLPCIGVTVRRLHDTGRSGWWILINLLPVIGIIVMIYWLAQPGAKEANKYA